MTQLQQLTEIIEKSKAKLRYEKSDIFRELDSETIAIKTAKILANVEGLQPLTAIAGKIGKSIIGGYDTTDEDELTQKKTKIQCGLGILRKLEANNLISFSKDYNNRGQLMLSLKDKEFFFALALYFPADKLNQYSYPTIFRPNERKGFYDTIGGPLVPGALKDDLMRFNAASIPQVYSDINKLQQIPYIVNTELLDCVKQLQDKPLFTFKNKLNIDADALNGLKREKNSTLHLAESLKDNTFYFYWNLDWRGRYYNTSSYLSTQGSKLSKSLIKLKNKKELGKEGWFWLLVHTANCAGQDKLAVEKRFEWSNERVDELYAIGADLVSNYENWCDMDDPMGFAASCLEVFNAIESGDKYTFKSGLIVGFDATTSGLQIFSMLGRDEITGKLCNLTDSNEVGDSYLHIADKVWADIKSPFWIALYDKRRKIVKRSVMTFLYSCGKKVMGEHIYSDFKTEFKGINENECNYLGKMIHSACKVHLPGPANIMKLFIKAGEKLANNNENLFLSGKFNSFPFIQDYREDKTARIEFKFKGNKYQLRFRTGEKGRQIIKDVVKGSAPNIIHSLDAQLVSMLVGKCEYNMVPTHDWFGATAADAGHLYEETRSSFYTLFGEDDTLNDICNELDIENTIEYGKLNPTELLDNEYCFS